MSSLIEVSAPHVRSSTVRHFSRPSRSPPSRNRLELFQASPMERREHQQHDIRGGPVSGVTPNSRTKLTAAYQSGRLFAPIVSSV
jgi:hypothetical protein